MIKDLQQEVKRAIQSTVPGDCIFRIKFFSEGEPSPTRHTLLVDNPAAQNVSDVVVHDAISLSFSNLRNDEDDQVFWGIDAHPIGATFFLFWITGLQITTINGFVREGVSLTALRSALRTAKPFGHVKLREDRG